MYTAQRALCEITSTLSPAVAVQAIPLPEKPQIISPGDGEEDVERRPTIRRLDPGRGRINEAVRFQVETPEGDLEETTRTELRSERLAYGSTYTWRVRAVNRSGRTGPTQEATF